MHREDSCNKNLDLKLRILISQSRSGANLDTMHYQSHTLVDVAYKALKRDIAERILPPGQKIIIRELQERYGISGTPIKQALNRMITEGLVENNPRKGIKVRVIQWEEIEELMDIRLMIETYYAMQMVSNFNDNENLKEKLASNLLEHRQMVENSVDSNDHFQIYYLDQAFHQLLIECSRNKTIMQIYKSLGTHIYAHYIYGRQEKIQTIAGVNEHVAMYNALVAQDGIELQKIIETHIDNAKNKIRKSFTTGRNNPHESEITF